MELYQQLERGFHFSLLPQIVGGLLVLRYLFRHLFINILGFKTSVGRNNVDSIFFTVCSAAICTFGWWINWNESWLKDYDDCYRGLCKLTTKSSFYYKTYAFKHKL
jgi:hypothetical protein